MKARTRKTGVAACLILFVLSAGAGVRAQDAAGVSRFLDPALFPAEFFPDLEELSERELLLTGLRTLYPKRILDHPPAEPVVETAPPVVHELEGDGRYIRVKNLQDALPVIREHLQRPLLVLDFRFLQTDLESTIKLGSLLTARARIELRVAGEYAPAAGKTGGSSLMIDGAGLRRPTQAIFTLSNHETSGPIEVLLAELKASGEIVSVGAPSPGKTASFAPFPGVESHYLIAGELRTSDGGSILESGFIPRVKVQVDPRDDELAYNALREGVALKDLVDARVEKTRFDEARLLREQNGGPPEDNENGSGADKPEVPQDAILTKAMHIVQALQALGKIAG